MLLSLSLSFKTLLSIIYIIYLEHIMREAIGMESSGPRVSGRTIYNLRFADDIGLVAELLDQAQLLLDIVD